MAGQNDFKLQTTEIAKALSAGDIEQAVRQSGMLLANLDNSLRDKANKASKPTHTAKKFIEAAELHVRSLIMANAHNEAFGCAVGALLTVEIYKLGEFVNSAQKLRLYYLAVNSAIDIFESQNPTAGDINPEHCSYILSYLSSLLYYYYNIVMKESPNDEILGEVYCFLKSILSSGAIQSPTIKLGDKAVSPAESGPLLVDILSRAAALGIVS